MVSKVVFIFSFLFVTYSSSFQFGDSLDELVDYVTDSITFTSTYTLNTNNSDLYNITNTTVNDYGTFDFVIVGGGSAGTLLARRLSEVANWTVLILEAGNITDLFTEIPFMNLYTRNSPYNWGFQTIPQNNSCLGMVDRRCVYPMGKGLGGSAIIGDSVYTRGNRADFDALADLGLEGWSFEEMLPYYKKTEQTQIETYDAGYHGHDGLLKINYTYPNPITYDYYLEAAKLAGLKSVDYNGEDQLGISKFQWTIDFNKKTTGGNAFILPILNETTNLNLTTKAFVTKILFTNTTATGVQFVLDGKIYNVTASKELILSAGAISTPQLLLLSGVGPQEDLEELDIEVVKDLPVGKYLIDHPVYAGLYIRTNLTADAGNLTYNLQRWVDGLGFFTTVFSADNIQYINTRTPGTGPPNVELLTINPPTSVPPATYYNLNENYTDLFTTYNTLTDFLVYTINLQPKSRGYVKLNSSSPVDFPLINPGTYTDSDDEDIQIMYEAVKFVLDLVKTEPLQRINATVVTQAPGCEELRATSEDEYWYCAIKYLTLVLNHPAGTTRMGIHPDNSVVNGELKVHGISNLRIVDAGVFPNIFRAHPLAPLYALTEKIADLIKAEYNVQ